MRDRVPRENVPRVPGSGGAQTGPEMEPGLITITAEGHATTSVELQHDDAEWLAERLAGADGVPQASDAGRAIEDALDPGNENPEVRLGEPELAAVAQVLEDVGQEEPPRAAALGQLRAELERWRDAAGATGGDAA